jgi:hypothetical protein
VAELRVDGDELVLHLTPFEGLEGVHGELRVPVAVEGVVGCSDPDPVAAEISHGLGRPSSRGGAR